MPHNQPTPKARDYGSPWAAPAWAVLPTATDALKVCLETYTLQIKLSTFGGGLFPMASRGGFQPSVPGGSSANLNT
jgi:hypothetical protein